MIKYLENPLSGECTKIALKGAPKTYAQLCENHNFPLDSIMIFDQMGLVENKNEVIKDPHSLTIIKLPMAGDDSDVVNGVIAVAAIAYGWFSGDWKTSAQILISVGANAYVQNQQKKLANILGPEQDDFNALSARLNKNMYGQPMPVYIGRGVVSPDISRAPYSRLGGRWNKTTQYMYITYTFGQRAGVVFSNLKSFDVKLAGTDGVIIAWDEAIRSAWLVDTGPGGQLSKPLAAINEPSVSYSTKAHAIYIEMDMAYSASYTTRKGRTKKHNVPFRIEVKTGADGAWRFVGWTDIIASSGFLGGKQGGFSAHRGGVELFFQGSRNTVHHGRLGFRIPDSDQPTTVRVTFKVPNRADNKRFDASLAVEQFRSYSIDNGDYSEQSRLMVRYSSDGPWSRNLPPLTANYSATVNNVHTSNPAVWFRHFLTVAGFPLGMTDVQSITDWQGYCQREGLEYNRVIRSEFKIADLLESLAVVGHAKIAPIRGKLGVILFDSDLVVREFTLDEQLKQPPMTVKVARKPKIKGLEIAYLDINTNELMPLRIGAAPYDRIQIPGITREEQARNELERAWDELNVNYPIVTFPADDSALDLYRGQKIKVHGQAGVFSGVSECRILSVSPQDESVTITARIEQPPPPHNDNVVSIATVVPPAPSARQARADAITANAEIEAGNAVIVLGWKNIACDGQTIFITNEAGQQFVIQGAVYAYAHRIPLTNQRYSIEFVPAFLGIRNSTDRPLGSSAQQVSIYIDVEQLMDRYRADTPKVRGLRLIHTDPRAHDYRHQFSGASCTIGWKKLKAYPRYRVRIYDHESDGLLRSTSTSVNRYHYSIEKNKADTAALRLAQTATRTLRISVAGLSDDQTTGRVGSIVVYNRLPEKPRIAMAVLTPGFAEIKIISTPTDPDFMGYLVWQGMSADFAVVGNRVDSGNCVKLLAAQSSSFTINVPPGQTHYFKVAAFDDFTANPQKLNVSDSVEITGVKLLDIPDIESRLKVGWNRLEFNDGKALVDANGNPVYDLGDATPEVRTRFQQFLAAGLRGLKPPFKAWHADLIDGGMITTRSLGADKIRAGAIEAEHLSSNSSWSAFLSSHEMDVHNIYYDRYQYGADGHLLTQPDGTPHLKPGGGKKLFDYIEGKVSAPLGQFQYLEVEMGGLVQSFSKHIYRHSRNFLRLNIGGGNPAGSNYAAITAQNRLLGTLPLNRNITIPSALGGAARVISAQELTGTIMANSRVDLSFERNHLDQNEHTNANWRLFLQQRLLVTFEDGSATSVRGARVDAYGAETNAVQTINPNLIYLTLVGQPPLYQRTSQLSDVFDFNYGKKIRSLELSIWLDGLEAYPTYTATYASRAVKALARKILITGMDLSAVCMLDKTKKPGGTNGLIPW